MGLRLIAHSLLILSLMLFGVVVAEVYGGTVKAYDSQKNVTAAAPPPVFDFRPVGQIESLRFEHRTTVNDTMTITVRNSGNIPIRIRYILVNNLMHTNLIDGYVFDQEGNFYLARTIPAGGFGILKTNTLPEDLTPKDNSYNITMRTNIGMLNETFNAGIETYPTPSLFEPFTPHILALLFGSTVSVFYYRRFKALG